MGIQERKQREREQRREMIIVAASKVFIEKGLGGTTMEEIASRAELSKATLYLYFKNKEELFLAVMIIVLDRFCDHMQQEMGSDKPVLQRMVTMGSNYLSFFYRYPEYFEMLNDMEPPDDFNFAQYEVSTDLVKANARIWGIICAPIIDGIKDGTCPKIAASSMRIGRLGREFCDALAGKIGF